MEIKIPKLPAHRPKKEDKKKYLEEMNAFANRLKQIQSTIGFKVSSRGWCYLLENEEVVTKPQFNDAQKAINDLRKSGILPIDFVEPDEARAFYGRDRYEEYPTSDKHLADSMAELAGCQVDYECVSFWEFQPCYIQMIVEKVDLRTLFRKITDEYRIPIANAKGWQDISMRNDMAQHFKKWEEKGKKPVLLYCGDHDPVGIHMSEKAQLFKGFKDIESGAHWDPKNLESYRFGLNYDFIEANNILWIDNLLSAKGNEPKKFTKGPHKGEYKDEHVRDYIKTYGIRKVEANALVVRPDLAEQLVEDAVQKYLGKNPFPDYNAAIKEGQDEVVTLMDKLSVQSTIDDEWLKQLGYKRKKEANNE